MGLRRVDVVDAFQGCGKSSRAPHAIDAMLTHWLISHRFQGDTLLASRAIVDAVVFEARGFRAAAASPILRQVVSKMLASYRTCPTTTVCTAPTSCRRCTLF